MIEDELVKILGADGVARERAAREAYSADMSFAHSIMPDCVARPRNAEEIAKIVKLANLTLTPLVPVSSGPPHFRGDTVPGMGGTVIVDLRGMKSIVRVDRQNKTALCEPGTTFAELLPAVEKEGLRLNMPLLPRRSKSVVGSLLEREPVTMPGYHWDIADPLACVEVVFGTGDLFRTGSAAGPGTLEDQWARGLAPNYAEGPSQASLHRVIQGAQGTMGIVTWASMRCELLPELEEPFMAGSPRLDTLLDLVHWLIRLRLVDECFIVNNTNLAVIMAATRPDDFHELKSALPRWILFFTIAGYTYMPEERVDYQTRDMMDLSRRVAVAPAKTMAGIPASELLEKVRRPSDEPYWKLRRKGGCQDIHFLTLYDKLPGLVAAMGDRADAGGCPSSHLGVYLQPLVQGSTCHCEFNLFYDRESARESDRIRDLVGIATRDLMARGAFFSRPYGENAKIIMNGDAATSAALAKVKAIFDPNNIMNPGKLCF
jgi:FAD/FMN-containing dehydrogenase